MPLESPADAGEAGDVAAGVESAGSGGPKQQKLCFKKPAASDHVEVGAKTCEGKKVFFFFVSGFFWEGGGLS